ncbi:hypothetical protein PhCBS80983_g05514 [Powellomyces hirtus]|uniref:Uncharacterized protein n=1 Tax=Powellomyces hirtus TaxID=109895 RepID=A0A507DVJ3_9FUNG|nr:hypothetical protein PhCBS80983_g05514 [Powellomyces hirtus]
MENIPHQKLSLHLRTCRGTERSATATDDRHTLTALRQTGLSRPGLGIAAQLDRAVELNRLNQAAQRSMYNQRLANEAEWEIGADYPSPQSKVFGAAEAAEQAGSPTRGMTSSSSSSSRFVPKKTVLSQSAAVTASPRTISAHKLAVADSNPIKSYEYDDDYEEDHLEDFDWQEARRQPSPPVSASRPQAVRPEWNGEVEEFPTQTATLDDRHPCPNCGRKFAEQERLDKHAVACSKLKPRKVYDPLKARIKGTELEQYAGKIREVMADEKHKTKASVSHDATPLKPKPANWRVKHDKFIQMVRAARQPLDADSSGSGAASRTNFVPSEPDPDLVPCEYCNRRFQKDTAARHIPFCRDSQQKKHYRTTAVRPSAGTPGTPSRENMMKKRVAYKPPAPKTRIKSPVKQ